jgi:hypothetical protein
MLLLNRGQSNKEDLNHQFTPLSMQQKEAASETTKQAANMGPQSKFDTFS